MKGMVKQLFMFALVAVMSLIFYDIMFNEERKDIYWYSFNGYLDSVILEDTQHQGKDMTEKYNELFHEANGETYKVGE